MSQFIYTVPGKQCPASVIHKTVSFDLKGAEGVICWTDMPFTFAKATREQQSAFAASFRPLDETNGIITGATFFQVRIEKITDLHATLEVLPAEGPENLTWGLLAQMRSNMKAVSKDLRVIAALV